MCNLILQSTLFYFTGLSLNTNHILIILYPLFEIFNMEKTTEEEYVCTL